MRITSSTKMDIILLFIESLVNYISKRLFNFFFFLCTVVHHYLLDIFAELTEIKEINGQTLYHNNIVKFLQIEEFSFIIHSIQITWI